VLVVLVFGMICLGCKALMIISAESKVKQNMIYVVS